jgi:hypothetical protein
LDTLDTQLSFAVEKFGGETRQDTTNAVTVEVGHDAATVRQVGQRGQCCPTLEIDADPRKTGWLKPFGPVAQKRGEELRLSGSRSATDQNMRHFRGQVESKRATISETDSVGALFSSIPEHGAVPRFAPGEHAQPVRRIVGRPIAAFRQASPTRDGLDLAARAANRKSGRVMVTAVNPGAC